VAHINFQLRGKDSDEDASLVRSWCSDHDVHYLELISDTLSYATQHKLNTQSAAREIRYNWWKKLVEKESFQRVVTAHHLDDNMETFFLNLLRGTGIKGLRGIPVKRDFFIRPMMDVSRTEIEAFALDYNIPFRNDLSNESDDYRRNRIRHHLIPLLRELSPDLNVVMLGNKKRMELEWEEWDFAYQHWQKNNVVPDNGGFNIKSDNARNAFLLKWLEERNIPWSLGYDFISSHDADTGKVLVYDQFTLSRSREGYYFASSERFASFTIEAPGIYQVGDHQLKIELVSSGEFANNNDPNIEFADLQKVAWPLELSEVTPGDYFQPLGMQGKRKKIQDYLTDLKLDHHEKNKIRLLKSSEQVIWLVGKRLDERVRVKPDAKEIYKLIYA